MLGSEVVIHVKRCRMRNFVTRESRVVGRLGWNVPGLGGIVRSRPVHNAEGMNSCKALYNRGLTGIIVVHAQDRQCDTCR